MAGPESERDDEQDAEPGSSDEPGGPAARSKAWSDDLHGARALVGLLLGQLGLLAALAFYFGRVSTSAFLGHFGLSSQLVDLSTQEYVLRSVGASYWPLMVAAIATVVVVAAHSAGVRSTSGGASASRPWWSPAVAAVTTKVRPAAGVLGGLLLVLAAAGLQQRVIFPARHPVIPLLIAAGTALISYGWLLGPRAREGRDGDLAWQAQVAGVLSVVVGALFWAWASYAATSGADQAEAFERRLAYEPAVTVFAARPLVLNGYGLQVDEVGVVDSAYRFRYSGLRLLLRSGERYFLLPVQWQPGDSSVIVLRESSELRLEFTASPYQ